ncbi:MAG TPA: NAD(+) synthase [Candidatus Alectryocaccomicrobium excrementavium]|uniref:Glutamine-dependent NAD(+) synthetase n=1 Tax=Candidatus Alectryocaccomicrobium excrementavium TaxID=2840668 RepID=A0A9D1G340_9FIRM|nr:NAD(+) synthase [Candidatus Alectryocaccomicrobium excrementavium]
MHDGFVRIAAGTPQVFLADTQKNARAIIEMMRAADARRAKLLVLPEMCLTGYSVGDLVLKDTLLRGALNALEELCRASEALDVVTVAGLPLAVGNRLFNCAAVIHKGRVLGAVPKTHLPNYAEYYELRHFAPGPAQAENIVLNGESVPFGADLLFRCINMPEFCLGIEICEDLWVPNPPGVAHALAGATVIANPSASNELVGKADYRRLLLESQSARLVCGYVYADAGQGESSMDSVFAGHDLIYENGERLAESRWENGLIFADVDAAYLASERRRMNAFREAAQPHREIPFALHMEALDLSRAVAPLPFVPQNAAEREQRCEQILRIQAGGLARRMAHAHAKCAVIGVSGGLDSTLALIVAARAARLAGLGEGSVVAVTMPCFGTTERTHANALKLAEGLGAQLIEVNIAESTLTHLRDIGHSPDDHDVTYENAQARERTQVLMDIANQRGGLVVGTGDLSELALGWATYNGDHMSMYGVNASIPKTLIRHLVRYVADAAENPLLREALLDVLDTPVSPELLPPVDGVIAQRTEDIVGPYELHDFMLYHIVRRGESPKKALRLAKIAFAGQYDDETILRWEKTFLRRFFQQQFKRSCLPDGPKVGSVSLSPRADWRMPSDAFSALWDADLENGQA